jgi:Homeodomain-like domain-containing protein
MAPACPARWRVRVRRACRAGPAGHAARTSGDHMCTTNSSWLVDFPAFEHVGPVSAAVRFWSPIRRDGRGDIAGLVLDDDPPLGARPVTLHTPSEVWGHAFRSFGFPESAPNGTWASGQQRRERLRLEAAGRFARGEGISEIARALRVTPGSVRRWRQAWRDGGAEALRSKGPVSRERLSPQQWARAGSRAGQGGQTDDLAPGDAISGDA